MCNGRIGGNAKIRSGKWEEESARGGGGATESATYLVGLVGGRHEMAFLLERAFRRRWR